MEHTAFATKRLKTTSICAPLLIASLGAVHSRCAASAEPSDAALQAMALYVFEEHEEMRKSLWRRKKN